MKLLYKNKKDREGRGDCRGFSLIEVLIVTVIGLFILEAAYFLYTGSMKLFKDVKTKSDNIQTKVPSLELISRYFDRWGVGVSATGSDCTNYPPVSEKCITVTNSSPCDEVYFWGNTEGTGIVMSISGTTAYIISCRLKTGSSVYSVWRSNSLQSSGESLTGVSPLSVSNADCSSLTSSTTGNLTVTAALTGVTLQAGDVIHRAPYKVRFYCGSNSSDSNNQWLYVEQTDTSGVLSTTSEPIAPVNSFQVELLPSGCTASSGGCTAAKVTMQYRSQSKKYDRTTGTYSAERVFGR